MARGTRAQEFSTGKRRRGRRVLFGILVTLFILALLVFALSPFVAYSVKVSSGAMSPAIAISDTVGVNHLAYLLLPPARGDIIQFRIERGDEDASSGEGSSQIRRIVGLPGETVQISDGAVYINGYPLKEDYISGDMTYGGTASSALTLSSDEYFVMADNRTNNFDSRDSTVGPISGADIIGKVWLRLKPFEHAGLI